MSSISQQCREEGNKFYASVTSGMSPALKRFKLQEATNCYYKALNASQTEDEKVSAAKNLAMAAWHQAQVEEVSTNPTSIVFFYKEAFKYFSLALNEGFNIKPRSWQDNLKSSATHCWETLKNGKCSEMDIESRVKIYYDIIQEIKVNILSAECYLEIGKCHFHIGVTAIEKGRFQRALSEMKNCYTPLQEAMACGKGSSSIEQEANILQDDVFMHLCMAESIQARTIGDNMYRQMIMNEEALNMDMVWEVVDWYKLAVIRTREVTEVELEAIALSRLGSLYHKVLKMRDNAKRYLMRSMELAHSMQPRTFTNVQWFIDCSEILQAYQKDTVTQEEDKWNREREELKKEMTKELDDLTRADKKDDLELLDYLYREYPPKNPVHKEFFVMSMAPDTDVPQKKKHLQQAVVNYHPDRLDVDKHGKICKVITEEITKMLTKRYQRLK